MTDCYIHNTHIYVYGYTHKKLKTYKSSRYLHGTVDYKYGKATVDDKATCTQTLLMSRNIIIFYTFLLAYFYSPRSTSKCLFFNQTSRTIDFFFYKIRIFYFISSEIV